MHGEVRLLDGQSIRSRLPLLFQGRLPDLNFGTNDGAACRPDLAARACEAAGEGFSRVLDGRFKGGYITRHYGAPADGVQAMQLEMAQRIYMDEEQPGPFDPARAAALIGVLRQVVAAMRG